MHCVHVIGDETKSTVSDTWSTDVLASDSEPPEQTQYERLSEVAEEMARANLLLGVQEVGGRLGDTAGQLGGGGSTVYSICTVIRSMYFEITPLTRNMVN